METSRIAGEIAAVLRDIKVQITAERTRTRMAAEEGQWRASEMRRAAAVKAEV